MGDLLDFRNPQFTELPELPPVTSTPPPRPAPSTVPNGGTRVDGPICMSCGPDQPGFSFEPTGEWKTSLYVSNSYIREDEECGIETSYQPGGLGLDPETQFDNILAFVALGQPTTETRLAGSRAVIKREIMGSNDALLLAFPKKDLFIRIRIWSLKPASQKTLPSLIDRVVQTFRWIPANELSLAR